ncbi:MAG: Planctomycete cytochrome [Akkermansiaceae bacterium]|nr:Planctomycete cytochrome [Akkermansiaceae bacterium]
MGKGISSALRSRGAMVILYLAGALALGSGLTSCGKSHASESEAGSQVSSTSESVAVQLPREITFNEHIQPILSEHCYHCHGPDSGTRKPKESPLRLDLEADAFAKRENGQAVIVKGDPDHSLLIKLVKTGDEKKVMPPRESHKDLKPQEIALLEEWIRQGAKYEPHWSFAAIRNPELPKEGEGFATNPIDRFIAQKLSANGLEPNPPEDPRRFYRRLSLDLTGLPPSPGDTDQFVKRSTEAPQLAVEEAADRLMATSASAEHFTRQWLDAARYGDTHGIQYDNYRAIWPYRDWVIRAFQANMPWDRFTIEQIAGDLLPEPSLDQIVATGFNRCLITTNEGGAIPEEYEAIYAKDRTETMSGVWLGLTTGCAACHDHKFDPVSTKDFYSLTAFFRNNTMEALDGDSATPAPVVFVPLMEDRQRWAEVASGISATERAIEAREKAARPDFEKWLSNPAVIPPSRQLDSNLAIHVPLIEGEGTIKGTVDGQAREWPAQAGRIDGPLGKALLISEAPVELGDLGSFSRGDQVTYGGFVRIEGTPTGVIVARMNPGQAYRGWNILLLDGKLNTEIIETVGSAVHKYGLGTPLPPGEWHHVMITFDGTRPASEISAIYIDGVRQAGQLITSSIGNMIEADVPLRLGAREGNDARPNTRVALQDFRFYRRVLGAEEIQYLASAHVLRNLADTPVAQRTAARIDYVFRQYVDQMDGPLRDLRAKLEQLKKEEDGLRARGSMSLVMEERKDSAPAAHVLVRGVYSNKGEKVSADVPGVLPPLPAGAPHNRLGLARWLVDPANPLPARVTMNRMWAYYFGTGIVETAEDFGVMGARPSHPRLLDWLAHEFIASQWDYRHMVKLLVTSATYRQSAALSAEKLEKDPLNRLLSRGPRVRLDGEQLRDLALAASDLLVNRVGGPPVKPYQPDGVWETIAMAASNTRFYKQDAGEGLYRRSLYTFWKRSAPPPAMELFNAPSREVFCVRRERTNTPLQALVMLNDLQFVEASKVLAAHALEKEDSFDTRLDFITSRLLNRPLNPDERTSAKATLDRLRSIYTGKPDEAVKLLAAGEKAAPAQLDPVELAAWTVFASQILNLDETITR